MDSENSTEAQWKAGSRFKEVAAQKPDTLIRQAEAGEPMAEVALGLKLLSGDKGFKTDTAKGLFFLIRCCALHTTDALIPSVPVVTLRSFRLGKGRPRISQLAPVYQHFPWGS